MALLVGVSGWLSLTMAHISGEIAFVWVSNGVFVGWLLSRPTSAWAGYFLSGLVADFAARQLSDGGSLAGAARSAFDLLEVAIVAGNVRRLIPDIGDPRRWLSLGGIATGSTLVACAISALLGAAVVANATGTDYSTDFLILYSTHVVGMVVVATLTLVVHREGFALLDVPGRRWDFVGTMLTIALVCGMIFYQNKYPFLFLAYPPLLWGVFRHRFPGVVVGVSLLAIIGGVATAYGHGPLSLVKNASDVERIILLQLFVGTACLMAFPVALTLAERTRLQARMRESELRYRMLADYSGDVVVRMRPDGHRLYVSPSIKEILGWEPSDLLHTDLLLVHPEDHELQLRAIARTMALGEPQTATYRVRHKDGRYVWIEAIVRPIPSAERTGAMDIIYAGRDISLRVAAQEALQASRRELEKLARVDELTNLANRRQFEERLALALTRARRQGLAIVLMFIDIDYFKDVNDTCGHAAGDDVLRTFASRLTASVRAGDLVARLGGDEFVVLVEDAATREAAEAIARKLSVGMGSGIDFEGSVLHVTASIGIAFAASAVDSETLLSAADAALYAAKKAGRNTYRIETLGAGQADSKPPQRS